MVFKKQPVEALHTIVNGTKGILEVQRKQPSCSLIYLSSEEVYGTPKDKEAIPESFVGRIDSLNTRSSYPLGKKTAELMCRAYFEEYGLDTKIIRPTVIIGLYQPYDSVKIEAEILRCIVENKDLYLKSSGTTKKTVIYTLDTISAVFTVLFKGESGQAYNATNPQTFNSVRDSASLLFQKFNPNCKIVFPEQDTSSALGYLPERAMLEDISRIESLGWKPMTSLEMIFRNEIQRFKHDKQNSHKA